MCFAGRSILHSQAAAKTTIARASYGTPLRTDARLLRSVPGPACVGAQPPTFGPGRSRARLLSSIAAALPRVKRLSDALARWLFADARSPRQRLRLVDQSSLAVACASRTCAQRRGAALLLRARAVLARSVRTPRQVVVCSRRTHGRFARALRSPPSVSSKMACSTRRRFPLGDIVATKADPQFGPDVRARTSAGLDVATIAASTAELRRIYWDTARIAATTSSSSPSSLARAPTARSAASRPTLRRTGVRCTRFLPWSSPPCGSTCRSTRRSATVKGSCRRSGAHNRPGAAPRQRRERAGRRRPAAHPSRLAAARRRCPRSSSSKTPGPRGNFCSAALGAAGQRADLRGLDHAVAPARLGDSDRVGRRRALRFAAGRSGWREDALGLVDYAARRDPGRRAAPVIVKRAVAIAGTSTPNA